MAILRGSFVVNKYLRGSFVINKYLRGSYPITVIVYVDMESGVLASEFTSTVIHDGLMTIQAGAALNGTTKGLQVVIDGIDALSYGVISGLADASGKSRARFYFDPNSITMGSGEYFCMLLARDSIQISIYEVYLHRHSTGVYQIWARAHSDIAWNYDTGAYTITDAPHYIEVYLQRGTVANKDGIFQLWIDGVSKETINDVANYAVFADINDVNLGAVFSVDAGTTGTIFLDELIVNRDGTGIGA